MRLAEMDTCSITDLRRNPSARVEQVRRSGHPLLITRRGTPIAVLMSIEQYAAAFREHDRQDYRCYLEEKYR